MLVFDKENGTDENEGGEHLDELRLSPTLRVRLQVREVTLVEYGFTVELVKDLEETVHARECTRDLSNDHDDGLGCKRGKVTRCLQAINPHANSDSRVEMSSGDRAAK